MYTNFYDFVKAISSAKNRLHMLMACLRADLKPADYLRC